MVRSRSPLLLSLFIVCVGCGGRDPLDVPVDDGTGTIPDTGGNLAPDGSVTTTPPANTPPTNNPPGGNTGPGNPPPTMPAPDAGAVFQGPDAGVRRDAAPTMPPPSSCAPKCLAALEADCMPSGACMQQRAGRGGAPATCYANGVKFLPMAAMGGTSVTRVTKPDGTLCYTLTVEAGGGGVTAFTYGDPSGNLVARVTNQNGLSFVTCAGEMTPQAVMTGCLGPAMMTGGGRGGGGGNMCSAGMCM
jgi:hypothetical protein